MKTYTITLTKNKEILFKETVMAFNKAEAWDIVKGKVTKAIHDKGQGDIEIKEG